MQRDQSGKEWGQDSRYAPPQDRKNQRKNAFQAGWGGEN